MGKGADGAGPKIFKEEDYDVSYDKNDPLNRATQIKVLSCNRPHMRAFHFSWTSFFLAFLGWFAFAPLMPVIKGQIGLTKKDGWTVNIASVGSTIFMRFLVGPLCDEYGPRILQTVLLSFGGVMILIAAAVVTDTLSLGIMRFLIGIVGATFVPCQYWNTLLFTKEVAGTAQAMAGGWGNLGGGATQIIMPLIYEAFLPGSDEETAWRLAFIVPGTVFLFWSAMMVNFSDDTGKGNYGPLIKAGVMTKKKSSASAREGFGDSATWVLALQYGCCFGIELTVNNMMASYFFNRFDLTLVTAGAIASSFGLMNLFARALGGLFSDYLNAKMGFVGRLYAQMLCLGVEGFFLIIFSRMDTVASALPMLICFSLGVQSAEGTSFGIVPYVKPKATGAVAGVVGAGGNIGAVCWGMIFRFAPDDRPAQDTLLILGIIVAASALISPAIMIEGQPGILGNPRYKPEDKPSTSA